METATPVKEQSSGRKKEPLSGAFFWVLAFFVVYCARPEDWIPGVAHIHPAMIVGIFAACAFIMCLGRLREGLPKSVLFLILLLVQLFIASVLSPVWKGGAIGQTIDFSKMVLIVIVMMFTVTSLARFRKLIFVQTAAIAVVALISIVSGHLEGGRLEGVLNGVYQNPNDLAIAAVLSSPIALVFLFRAKGALRKLIWSVALAGMLFTVLRTASRAGFIALLVAAILCIWEFGFKGRRMYVPVVAVLAGLILFLVAGGPVTKRLADTFGTSGNFEAAHDSQVARTQLQIRSLEVTAEHPLFGVGPGNFQVVGGTWQPTHDVYTAISSEGGIPALILYLLLYWAAFADLRRLRRLVEPNSEIGMFAAALRASLWAFALAAPFFPDAYQYFLYFMLAFATVLATAKVRSPAQEGAAPALNSRGAWNPSGAYRPLPQPGGAVR
ncbi:MAG: O-antigen ligase family protein [Terriglobia bacterium]